MQGRAYQYAVHSMYCVGLNGRYSAIWGPTCSETFLCCAAQELHDAAEIGLKSVNLFNNNVGNKQVIATHTTAGVLS
jgi:hypothetical protein